jgi:uncharacterized protein (DUF1778 family)
MPKKIITPPEPTNTNYRIRFRDRAQLAVLKRAATKAGLSFNDFVNNCCDVTAEAVLKMPDRFGIELMKAALKETDGAGSDA